MAFAPQRENPGTDQRSLLERGWDFGFESFFPGGLFGGLPSGARTIVESIWNNPGPTVIGEIPQTWEEAEETNPEWFEPILETRPGRVADSYPQDVVGDTPEQEDDVAHDWGHLIREGVSSFFPGSEVSANLPPMGFSPTVGTPAGVPLPTVGGGGCEGMAWSGAAPPKGYKVVNYCGQGVLRKIRRRRRRRMLTASDAADLATIVGIVGKGQMASSMINRTRS